MQHRRSTLARIAGVTALILAAALPPALRASDAPPPVAAQVVPAGPPVTTHTYLTATPGRRDALARFIVANWFEMDRIAVAQGLFRSYRLLQNPRTDEDWDLIVEVVYHDACGYACVAERFEAIRGAHATVPADGLGMKDLGRVVRSVAFQQRPAG